MHCEDAAYERDDYQPIYGMRGIQMRLIDADALAKEMYRKSFEVDDGRNRWDSGLWIRYKIFEEAIMDAPTVTIESKDGENHA